jgi:alanine racemase
VTREAGDRRGRGWTRYADVVAPPTIEERLAVAGLPSLTRLAWVEVDLEALASNLLLVRELIPSRTRVAAVVKADAYGHGLEMAARTFVAAGADALCVATLEEGVRVRSAAISAPVIVLFPVPAGATRIATQNDLQVVATDSASADRLIPTLPPRGRLLRVHLEVETGLQRGGVLPAEAAAVAQALSSAPGIELAGLWSHLASPADAQFTARQRARFEEAMRSVSLAGVDPLTYHLDASGGLFFGTGAALDMVRPGLCLYGVAPALPEGAAFSSSGAAAAARLRPAMSLHARPLRIADVAAGEPVGYGGAWTAPRDSRIATLPIGYGDGYARTSQPGAEALVRGQRVPIIGNIAMDALHVDVTDVPGVLAADEFVLLGGQGEQRISADDLARRRNTIAWEVLTSVTARLTRVYDAAAGLKGVRTLAGETLVEEQP